MSNDAKAEICSIATISPETADQQLAAFERSVDHHYASNKGVRIHYAAAGTGPLLVFLHGFPDHWLGWWPLMVDLQRDYRVVALDLRGYNLSDRPANPQSYEVRHLVEDVRAVVQQEGKTSAIIVGHDWGGFVAWHAAMDAPELVQRLVVLGMPHPWAIARELAGNPAQRKASEYVRLFKQPGSHAQFPVARLSAWVTDSAYKTRHDRAMAASSVDAMFNYYRLNWPAEPYQDRSDPPPQIKVPTLLLHGRDDPYALPAGLNGVWNWIDNEVTIVTLPGAGHFIQHDLAPQIARTLRGWLPSTSNP